MLRLTSLLFLSAIMIANQAADPPGKSKIRLGNDGFPIGRNTPEGAACDFARAFILRDSKMFTNVCARFKPTSKSGKEYADFIASKVESINAEANRKDSPPRGPKAIGKVYAARHLSKNGPASFGYAAFDFYDVMFVDVDVLLHGDTRVLNRTMVVKEKTAFGLSTLRQTLCLYLAPGSTKRALLLRLLLTNTKSKNSFETV
jgi:hypothetical protein